jgi:Uma2 family endonuclease
MSSEPVRRLSPEDFLAFERQAETKHEYVGGEVFAMSGASARHNVIVANLVLEIGLQFRGRPCRVFPSDLRVAVSAAGPFYYPDLSALCAEPRFLDDRFDTLLNPEVVIEVLSPSTEAFVRGLKFAHYRAIPSVQEVVLFAQDAVRIERFVRREGEWVLSDHAGPEAVVEIAALGCRLELARVYDKVEGLPVER